jgi:Ca2+-binding RTX toxin-like protein
MPVINGTSGADTLIGSSGDDTINGLGGNDILVGSGGGDTLDGGDGNDILFSAEQSPTFGGDLNIPPVFDTGTEVDTLLGGTGDDVLFAGYGDNVDGGAGQDTVFLSFLGAPAGVTLDMTAATHVIGGGTIAVESAGWVQGSNSGDTIILGDGYYTLNGYAGVALGMGGNDTLIAGYNTVVLDGGDGDDFVDARNSQYLQRLIGGAGNDILRSAFFGNANGGDGDDTIYIYGSAEGVGGNGNDTITIIGPTNDLTGNFIEGNAGNDTLRGGNKSDVLNGGADADVLAGNGSNDTLTGGSGNDVFQFGQADQHDTITDFASGDTVQVDGYSSAQSITQVGSDVLVVFSSSDQITFQNTNAATVQAGLVFGVGTNDTLTGGPEDDFLRGFGGNDTITGAGGKDTLVGDSGADVIDGGTGNDRLFSAGPSPLIGSGLTPVLDHGSEVDTLTGGDGNDIISAGYGDNVDGGSDSAGPEGDELYISFLGGSQGVNFDASLDTQVIGGGTITGIETFTWVEGSNFNDQLNLNDPNADTYSNFTQIYGMGGNDTLTAGWFTSWMDGGDGDDIVDGRLSHYLNEVDGGAGNDTLYTSPNYLFTPANGGDGNDTIYSYTKIHGDAGDDTIHVLHSTNRATVSGDDGNDTIDCLTSAGDIDGGAGNDSITCGGGFDTLIGGAGHDTLNGGGGTDTLTGGTGDDVLTGGQGNDVFIVGDGNDTITDLTAGDQLQIRAGFLPDSIQQVGSNVVITLSDGNHLTFQNNIVSGIKAALKTSITANDVTLSPDGSTIYVAGADGNLYAYSAETGDMLHAWHVGDSLGGMDVSLDGSVAVVADLVPVSVRPDPDDGLPIYTLAVHKVDLTTGTVTTFTHDANEILDYSFYDVAFLSDGTVLLSETLGPNASGGAPALILNPTTGSFTSSGTGADDGVLSRSTDGSTVVIMGQNSTDPGVGVYQTGVGIIASHGNNADGVYGFYKGVQAYSAEAGLIAQFVPNNGLNIYDGTAHYVRDLTDSHPTWIGGLAGLAFDASGHFLFVLTGNTIYQLSTADWGTVGQFALGTGVATADGDFGNRLLVGPNMRYFVVQTDTGGFFTVQNPNASATINGTTGADQIHGTGLFDDIHGNAGNDTIFALAGNDVVHGDAGNDTLDGGAGNDTLDGGADVDTASYATAASGVTVGLADAAPQNTLGAGVDTLSNLENLTGSAFNDTLTGNASANVLNGGAGADVMSGGTGNDSYVVDQAGDAISEVAGQGEDTVIAKASYALGAGVSVETMTTVNGSATTAINLIGNELAQSLYGNAGDNILTGMGGADYLVGGAGNDKYYVDQSDFISELVGGGDDWIFVPGTYILREGSEIETLVAVNQDSLDPVNLTGNEFGQSLYGSQGVNSLNGGAGNDYLVGLGGNDFLLGGAGNDNMAGGQGNDIYYVQDSGDQLFENAGEGDDIAVCFASFALGAGQSVETLSANESSGAINLTGNDLGQSLYGNSAANVLTSGGGADYMVGGAGNDTFVFTNAPGVATVGDYGAGDVVDIAQFLSVAGGTNVVGGGYVRIVGAQLQVDANGGGDSWTTVGNISGSSAVTIRYQSGGNATDLSVSRQAGQSGESLAKSAAVGDHVDLAESIIPPPPPHPETQNVMQTTWIFDDYTVSQGTELYADEVGHVFSSNSSNAATDFTNNGAIWSRAGTYPAILSTSAVFGHITNTGTMVAEATNGQGTAIFIENTLTGIDNSGSIYSITHNGSALTIWNLGSGTFTTNTGIIAAQTDNGVAYAIRNESSGPVHNLGDGQILAEGAFATAVVVRAGTLGTANEVKPLEIVNEGLIAAVATADTSFGIQAIHGQYDRFDILNSGTIRADYAIYVTTPLGSDGASETVTNTSTGWIDGRVYLQKGDDTLINDGRISGLVELGEGNDKFLGSLGTTSVTVDGGDGDDLLKGGTAGDQLSGGAGNDTIDGGAGIDTASYASAAFGVTVNLALGTMQDTLGAGLDTLSNIENLRGSELADALTGDGNANVLAGGGGIDTLNGGGGDDTLEGGAGADTLIGGLGNDRYVVDQQGDVITELAGEGEDMAILRASYTLGAGVSVEVMTTVNGSATTAINLIGNELAQSLYGNAGNNILMGNGGTDYMAGGSGNDVYYVDTSDFIAESVGGGDDMVVVPTSYILRDGVEIETLVAWLQDSTDPVNLTGNEFGQSLYGSQGVNSLNGGGGNDYLVGLGGNDFLLGGTGNDNMAGGQGNDIYYVDSAGDQIFETANEGDDIAVCFSNFALGAGQSVETLSAAEGNAAINLTGNALAQSLYGNAGANVLTGGGGADYLVGGAGNDVFVLSNPNGGGIAAIADYASGDVVDVTQVLSVAAGTDLVGGGYLKITAGGQIQVDQNGGGDQWVTLSNINGSSSVTVRYLSGGTATDLNVAHSASASSLATGLDPAAAKLQPGETAGSAGIDHDPAAFDSTLAAWHLDSHTHHDTPWLIGA